MDSAPIISLPLKQTATSCRVRHELVLLQWHEKSASQEGTNFSLSTIRQKTISSPVCKYTDKLIFIEWFRKWLISKMKLLSQKSSASIQLANLDNQVYRNTLMRDHDRPILAKRLIILRLS